MNEGTESILVQNLLKICIINLFTNLFTYLSALYIIINTNPPINTHNYDTHV